MIHDAKPDLQQSQTRFTTVSNQIYNSLKPDLQQSQTRFTTASSHISQKYLMI